MKSEFQYFHLRIVGQGILYLLFFFYAAVSYAQEAPIHDSFAMESNLGLPDFYDHFITEFELHDGEVIRGKVIRSVPNSHCEVKLYDRNVIVIFDKDVKSKHKVRSDIREKRLSLHLGLAINSSYPFNDLQFGLGFLIGTGYDFGKELKYSISIDLTARTYYINNESVLDSDVIFNYLIGYKHKRIKSISQSYFIGFSHLTSQEDLYPVLLATGRVEVPFTVKNRFQIVPIITLHHPLVGTKRINKGFLLAGIAFRVF